MDVPPKTHGFRDARPAPEPAIHSKAGMSQADPRRSAVCLSVIAVCCALPACETAPMAGDIARGIEIVRRTEDRPNEHVVLYRTRDQVLGRKLGRDETDAGRYLEKGAKIAVRNLFRQADLLDEDEIRINRMSHAERIDRDIRKHFRREDSGDREYERRRAKLDGNTTNLRRIGGGRVGVTESLHLNYEKDIYKGKLDIRPKVDVDEVGVYAAWRRTF